MHPAYILRRSSSSVQPLADSPDLNALNSHQLTDCYYCLSLSLSHTLTSSSSFSFNSTTSTPTSHSPSSSPLSPRDKERRAGSAPIALTSPNLSLFPPPKPSPVCRAFPSTSSPREGIEIRVRHCEGPVPAVTTSIPHATYTHLQSTSPPIHQLATMSKVVRSVKNVTKGYSSVQVKVRNGTSSSVPSVRGFLGSFAIGHHATVSVGTVSLTKGRI